MQECYQPDDVAAASHKTSRGQQKPQQLTKSKTITMPKMHVPKGNNSTKTERSRDLGGAVHVPCNAPHRVRKLRGYDFGASTIGPAVGGVQSSIKEDIVDKFFLSNAHEVLKREVSQHTFEDPIRRTETMLAMSTVEKEHLAVNVLIPLKQMWNTMALLTSFHKEFFAADESTDAHMLKKSLTSSGGTIKAFLNVGPLDYEGSSE